MGKRKQPQKHTDRRPTICCASVSFGAGSLYMLLRLLEEENLQLNMVIFVNMGKEFAGVMAMKEAVLPLLRQKGIAYQELDASKQFDYDAKSRPVKNKETGEIHRIGYGWCGGGCRYGTSLKLRTLYSFYRQNFKGCRVIEYIGICADEEDRNCQASPKWVFKRYPLKEWGVTKANAIRGCYERGFFYPEVDREGKT